MKRTLVLASSMLAVLFSLTPIQAADINAASRVYAVTKVAPDDGLNLRTQPGPGGTVVVVLPANAKGLLSLGLEKKTGNSTWLKVSWSGKEGWVNKYYLREDVDTTNYNPAKPAETKPAQPAKKEVVMECGGTEPFWSISISERDMKVNMMDGPQYSVPVSLRQQSANSTSVAVVAGNRGAAATTAFLEKVETCSDGMSDKNYPYSITAVLNGQKVVSGCCSISGAN